MEHWITVTYSCPMCTTYVLNIGHYAATSVSRRCVRKQGKHHDHAIAKISKASEKVFSILHGSIFQIIFTEKEFKAKQKESLIRSIIDNHVLICGKGRGFLNGTISRSVEGAKLHNKS